MEFSPRNILVVHIAGLARTTLALPALRSLRAHYPDARITVAAGAESADLIQLANCADEVLAIGRFSHHELINPGTFFRSSRIYWRARQSKSIYDLAIDFSTGAEGEFLLKLAAPRRRLGATGKITRGLGPVLDRLLRSVTGKEPAMVHLAHEYLNRLAPLGVRPVEAEPRLQTDAETDRQVEKMLAKRGVELGDLLIGIHPGADRQDQRWPAERFTSVASRMIHNFNARVLVFAGPRERGAARRIAAQLPAKRAIRIESPKLVEFVSMAARLSLMVTNHSGPAHVAAAAGTPVVAASVSDGPTPLDLLGRRVEHIRAPHADLITEDEMFAAACRLLKTSRAEFLAR